MPKKQSSSTHKPEFRQWDEDAPRKDSVASIGATLHQLIDEQRAVSIWSSVVGPEIARVTTAQSIRNGELSIKVANPTWRSELSYQSEEILHKLNAALGRSIVCSLKFK
jgi:predicted nucleic acid-binding Zn ribbon protein